jgi:hypothetical protein
MKLVTAVRVYVCTAIQHTFISVFFCVAVEVITVEEREGKRNYENGDHVFIP